MWGDFRDHTALLLSSHNANKRIPHIHHIAAKEVHAQHRPKPGRRPEATGDENVVGKGRGEQGCSSRLSPSVECRGTQTQSLQGWNWTSAPAFAPGTLASRGATPGF